MELEFLGHACVAVRSSEQVLIVDPYDSGQFGGRMAYSPIDVVANWVVCSHEHADHSATHALPGSPQRVESGTAGVFEITRFSLFHDEFDGRRRGGEVDALRIDGEGGVH